MNCREFTIEFEERGSLSEPARLHLTICADCRTMSERQAQVWLMIEGLKPIAAPSDFDFHVKARIAKAKPSDFRKPAFLPVLRYVLPLSLVILFSGWFIFNSAYFSGASNVASITQTAAQPSNTNAVPSDIVFPANQPAFAEPKQDSPEVMRESANAPYLTLKNDTMVRTVPKERPRTARSAVNNNSDVTSRDTALTSVVPKTPVGISFNTAPSSAPKIESPKFGGDELILSFLGMETEMKNGRRTVTSLKKDSPAERSGVKIGDVIEQFDRKNLKISRGTEKMEITLP